MSVLLAVQTALVQRLKGDAALSARVTGVFDGAAPSGTPHPYIVVGEKTETIGGVFGRDAADATITAHVWSMHAGDKEGLEIVMLMHGALREPLSLVGYDAAALRPDLTTTLRDPGGARHMVVRYRISAWENE